MFGKPTTSFDKLMEKATSQLLLDPDWNTILQICDAVRQEDVTPKMAMATVKKKITNDNPHVAKFALIVLESMVKNCGAPIQQEIATKEMMDFMREQILKRPEPIKSKLLELVQVWSHAFRTQPAYKIVEETYKMLKHEGHTFPVLREADAMFAAEKAPEWKDGETCHRCKDKFSTFNRKHHCRCCGDIFCNKCSSKNSIVPQFGIEREVRVCDACYDKLNSTGVPEDEMPPAEYLASSLARQPQVPPAKSERDIQQQEEEELQLAIALSQSEAEAKAKERERGRSASSRAIHNSQNGHSNVSSAPPQSKFASVPAIDTTDMDPELARYLDRNYWQQRREENKQGMQQPSAPVAQIDTSVPPARAADNPAVPEAEQNGDGGGAEGDEQFMDAVEKSIEIFVNRMKSDSLRGRSIAADSSVQTLFVTLSTMHSELLKNLHKLDDNRVYYESLQDKLAELKDAREALEVLREEHREKRRLEQEEQERQRQLAMAHKLDVLRLKKQEYLEHQRQLALQRMQEQELEMQMRIEQQKQMQQMRQMYNNPYMQTVYGSMTMTPQPYPGQLGSTDESSPHHYPAGPGTMPYGAGGYVPGQPPSGYPGGPQGPGAPYQQQPGGPQSVGSAPTYYPGYPGNQPSYHPAQQTSAPAGYLAGQPQGAAGTFQGQPQGAFPGQGQGFIPQQGGGGNTATSFQGYVGQGQGGPYQGPGQMDAAYQLPVGGYQGQPPAEYPQYAQQGGQYPQGQGLGGPQPGGYGGQDMAPVYQQQQHERTMNLSRRSGDNLSHMLFVNFNQDISSLAVGAKTNYHLYSLNSVDHLECIFKDEGEEISIVERLFSSSLVVIVSQSSPRKLKVCHFKKSTEICNYSYSNTILAVKLNRQRLVVCLEESLYIHNIRDMKVLHTIRDTPPNPLGLCALSTNNDNCYLAYPGNSQIGEVQIFDTANLRAVTMISAHDSSLAALAFNSAGTRLATASEKGTVIRVFSIPEGQRMFEFRRGMKRCVSISSIAFSPDSVYLSCCSNTESVHIFKLEVVKERSSGEESQGWMGYVGQALKTSAQYLPTQVTEMFNQGRDFAIARLPATGLYSICAMNVIQKKLYLLVACEDGHLYIYRVDEHNGGECALVKQHRIDGAPGDGLSSPSSGGSQPLLAGGASSGRRRQTSGDSTNSPANMRREADKLDPTETVYHLAYDNMAAADINKLRLHDDSEFPPMSHARHDS